ncbi:alpha/beta fold hydrolase [Aeromicrobium sp.]|uniref:alpha/beta fold hydrolase n=1 Tax=Aeromicrobium sp. TaxID=1871063 RepID=UPI0025C2F9D8|nr:alpha/beta fold hydrolase [Aeromicrobium sp.]MCK5890627.1 alpha/beta hydrolase [Aeromicrobium sp.]
MSIVILVPGFWLHADSWDDTLPPLLEAGHEVVSLTLPGLESVETDRAGIGLGEHVAAVVAEIDRHDEPVVLVGHSGGGTVIHAAVDQRPDRVARAVYVDSGPLPHGARTNPHLPAEGADLPLPPWDLFRQDGAKDLDGLDDAALHEFRHRAVPHPAAAASDEQLLSDDRRYDVPVTIVSCTFTREEIGEAVAAGVDYFAELPRLRDLTVVELPTGHWPQFSRPDDLGRAIAGAIG